MKSTRLILAVLTIAVMLSAIPAFAATQYAVATEKNYYKDENGKWILNSDSSYKYNKKGLKIYEKETFQTEDSKTGKPTKSTRVATMTYTSQGDLKSTVTKMNGKETYRYTAKVNKKGYITAFTRKENGKVTESGKFTYNKKNQLTKESYYDSKNKLTMTMTFTYDSKGYPKSIITKDGKGKQTASEKYTHKLNGKKIVKQTVNGESVEGGKYKYVSEFYANGKMKKSTYTASDSTFTSTYDKQGRQVKTVSTFTYGGETSTNTATYKNGLIVKRVEKSPGQEYTTVYKYTNSSKGPTQVITVTNGQEMNKTTYTYVKIK